MITKSHLILITLNKSCNFCNFNLYYNSQSNYNLHNNAKVFIIIFFYLHKAKIIITDGSTYLLDRNDTSKINFYTLFT